MLRVCSNTFFRVGVLILFVLTGGCDRTRTLNVRTETIKLTSLEEVVPVDTPMVKPVLYTHVTGLSKLPVRQAKAKFIAAVLPSILVAKHRIEQQRTRLKTLQQKKRWKTEDSTFYLQTRVRYKAKSLDELIYRMGTLPNSVVLAQTAVESGWGQSRFFLQGSNLFGIWSFNKYEPRIEAGKTRNKKRIYLRSYDDMSQSITHYFEILGHARSYNSLRKARLETDDPFKLLPHLQNFSERRTAYTNQLKKIIVRNNLTQYDQYQIDPQYIVEE